MEEEKIKKLEEEIKDLRLRVFNLERYIRLIDKDIAFLERRI